MDLNSLRADSRALFGLDLKDGQLDAFQMYSRLLLDWNSRLNLTAIRDPEAVRVRHFLDSLSCMLVLAPMAGKLVDVGTGAGFPGLVLKIANPQVHLTLVESVSKKARFCETVVRELGLTQVEIYDRRVEDIGQDPAFREQFDWAVARALAGMPVLAEYLLPLVKIGGKVLAQKGPTGSQELRKALPAVHLLGGRFESEIPVRLPGLDEARMLILLDKISSTPAKYPRRAGMPAKRPLSGLKP